MERGVTVRYKSVSKLSVLNQNIAHTLLAVLGTSSLVTSQVRRSLQMTLEDVSMSMVKT